MGDAYRNGLYDRAIETANKSFATNFALNAALDWGTGRFSKTVQGIQKPYNKCAAETASEIVNEILQEPSQHVIEQAAMNSLQKSKGFFLGERDNILQQIGNSELVQSAKQCPEIFTQLAPTVTSSTALTQAIIGLGGMVYNNTTTAK